MKVVRLFTHLENEELSTLARKMIRVIDDPTVGDYAWLDAEEVYQDIVRESFTRWNEGRWPK